MDEPEAKPDAAPQSPDLPEISRLFKGDAAGFFGSIDWSIFWTGFPLIVFLVLNSLWPEDLWRIQVAIVGSFLASLYVFVTNHDSGVIRAIVVLGFLIVSGSAIVGLAASSAKAFAAQNIYTDFIMVAVCLGSIAIGKPIVGAVARQGVPALRTAMDPQHRVFVYLTLAFMTINIITGILRIFLLGELDTNAYVLISRAVGLPFSVAFLVACYFAIKRTAGVSVGRLQGL